MVNKNSTIVSFNRVQNGLFEILLNGSKTNWEIFNGRMGASGRGNNFYGLHNVETGKIIWAGSLAFAKQITSAMIKKYGK
jgi:hypothetical protein